MKPTVKQADFNDLKLCSVGLVLSNPSSFSSHFNIQSSPISSSLNILNYLTLFYFSNASFVHKIILKPPLLIPITKLLIACNKLYETESNRNIWKNNNLPWDWRTSNPKLGIRHYKELTLLIKIQVNMMELAKFK